MVDTFGNPIKMMPVQHRLRGKKQPHLLIMRPDNNTIIPDEYFYFGDTKDLAKYRRFLELLFCEENVIIPQEHTLSIDELRNAFKSYKKVVIEDKIKRLKDIIAFGYLEGDDSNMKLEIKRLERELKE